MNHTYAFSKGSNCITVFVLRLLVNVWQAVDILNISDPSVIKQRMLVVEGYWFLISWGNIYVVWYTVSLPTLLPFWYFIGIGRQPFSSFQHTLYFHLRSYSPLVSSNTLIAWECLLHLLFAPSLSLPHSTSSVFYVCAAQVSYIRCYQCKNAHSHACNVHLHKHANSPLMAS